MRLIEFGNKENSFDPNAINASKRLLSQYPDMHYSYSPDQLEIFRDEMAKAGWKLPSNSHGAYSDVFVNPSKPYVLKINRHQDKAFAWFAFLTHKFPNDHFMKISNVKQITVNNTVHYAYLMEKLNKFGSLEFANDLAWVMTYIARSYSDADKIKQLVAEHKDILQKVGNQTQGLIKASLIIGYQKKKFTLDLSGANIMKRSDGTIVITDPYAGVLA